VVATDQDVTLSVETNSRSNLTSEVGGAAINERNIASPSSAGPPAALKLMARVNVMDVIADALAIKGSLLRCAQVSFLHSPSEAHCLSCRCMKGIVLKMLQQPRQRDKSKNQKTKIWTKMKSRTEMRRGQQIDSLKREQARTEVTLSLALREMRSRKLPVSDPS
jgi:hypothetical protein